MQPEIGVEGAPRPLVDLERVGVSTRTVERDHELRHQSLAVRVLLGRTAELARNLRVATEREVRVDAELESSRAEVFEALGLCVPVYVERGVREYRAVPQAERLLGGRRGTSVLTLRERVPGPLDEILEDARVEGCATNREPVADPRLSNVIPCGASWRRSLDT
jgi:hypothetical protein